MSGSINQCTPNSFLLELGTATHNFTNSTGDVFKMALFKSVITGTYGAATTNYSDMTGNSDEATGTAYSAGGFTMTNITPLVSGTTMYTSWSVNPNWPVSTISSIGAMIYNSSKSNKVVALLAFGSIISSTATTFLVTLPANGPSSSIVRIGY